MEFDDFVASRGAALLRSAYVLTGDRHRAEDLVQTALLKAYRHWSKVSASDSPDAYVRRIITTSSMDWWRRRTNHERPDVPEQGPDEPTRGRLDDPAELIEQRDELHRALATLTPRQRAVLVLRHYEGWADDEIARVIGCREASVRTHASRGRDRLRAALNTANTHALGEAQLTAKDLS